MDLTDAVSLLKTMFTAPGMAQPLKQAIAALPAADQASARIRSTTSADAARSTPAGSPLSTRDTVDT